jgi:hypothetical protein
MDKDVVWDMALAAVSTSLLGFAKSFPWQLLHDDIELRMCGDHLIIHEATPLEPVELYVQ